MKYELCFDDCLDLPSLTQIQGNQYWIHYCMGYVKLESMIWFDLIWFDLIWLDIPNFTENNIHYGKDSFEYTADLQATSIFPFHFHFHVLDAPALEKVIREIPKQWEDSFCTYDSGCSEFNSDSNSESDSDLYYD